jgi:hypothetical protein
MSRRLAVCTLLLVLLCTDTVSLAAQSRPAFDPMQRAGPHAELMLLGTFHFNNPGRDRYKQKFPVDMLSPTRQEQIEAVVRELARFRPTRVAVEWPASRQGTLDSLYQEYRAGCLPARASEVYQLGFRLAQEAGLDRVEAVDVERDQSFIALAEQREAQLTAADTLDAAWRGRLEQLYTHDDSMKVSEPLPDYLLALNSPARIRDDAGGYLVGTFKAGGDSSYAGPDFVAGWYDRNLRIFRNLQRITRGAGERIVVIYGAGHLGILRHLAEASPEYQMVDVPAYLGHAAER